MQLYLKLAVGNVRRSARDYSVYFATLGFAACLLYSFVASTDHVRAMGLSPEQMGVLGSAGDVLQAFSIFTVLVFLFLVRYANRFLLRRRKREFALYELCGMGRGAVSVVLVAETALVGAGALACGLAAGAWLSPAFGAIAAFVFNVPWRLSFTFSASSALWTGSCFAVVFAFTPSTVPAMWYVDPSSIFWPPIARPRPCVWASAHFGRDKVCLRLVCSRWYGARACFSLCTSSRSLSPWDLPHASPRHLSPGWVWHDGQRMRAHRRVGTGTGCVRSLFVRLRRGFQAPRWRWLAYACSLPWGCV